jgi:hypothetical protein
MSSIKRLIAQWGLTKTARRFKVKPSTISRWASRGEPAKRATEVSKVWNRVSKANRRYDTVNDEWAREVLTRWVDGVNQEGLARIELKNHLRGGGRRNTKARPRNAVSKRQLEFYKSEVNLLTEQRRKAWKNIASKRFRKTSVGSELTPIIFEIAKYSKAYNDAVLTGKPYQIARAWNDWLKQTKRILKQVEGLAIEGFSTRQIYTMFFSS